MNFGPDPTTGRDDPPVPTVTTVSSTPAVTILMIHGVGGFVDQVARRDSERLIASQFENVRDVDFHWFDWNKAISDPRSAGLGLQNITYGARASARLEFPDRIDDRSGKFSGHLRSFRTALWQCERVVEAIQLPLMALLLVHLVWLAAGWAARVLHQEPPLLELQVRLKHILLPALDPILLERSFPMALVTLPLTASLTLLAVPVLQITLAGISGGVPLRVALRGTALYLVRPLLAVLTMPGFVTGGLLMLSGGLALVFAVFSRPVQVLDLQGTPITYGGARLGIVVLPLAIFAGGVTIGVTSFVLRPFLKVISDIVRYLGDPEYRARIHAGLLVELERLGRRPVVIVAHSLGSVIAVDSLLAHPDAWSRFPALRLLTCGSPLKRLFHRFFPATYPTPEAMLCMLRQNYTDVVWANAYRPLDYVGGHLGRLSEITEMRLPQRYRFHIAYWTDRYLADLVNMLVNEQHNTRVSSATDPDGMSLSLDRFQHGTLGGEGLFAWVRYTSFAVGAVILIITQVTWVPRIERDHLQEWNRRLETEGIDVFGELCPQREIDTSNEFSRFERAVAGIRFTTRNGEVMILEAYSDSRPDIVWDDVQKAVFGRVPPSVFITGLRAAIFLRDPLLAIKDCQPVDVRYTPADPRIFRLPDQFHVAPAVGILTRVGRTALLLFLWMLWWGIVWLLVSEALGVARSVSAR
jgi:hypothetical protein